MILVDSFSDLEKKGSEMRVTRVTIVANRFREHLAAKVSIRHNYFYIPKKGDNSFISQLDPVLMV